MNTMISVGMSSILDSYQTYESKQSTKFSKADQEKKDTRDSLELSEEGQQAIAQSKTKQEKKYDLAKVMAIHEKGFSQIPTREESDYYWEARRNDQALDASLYASDKAKALKEVSQVQTILMKAITGQPLTPEEEQMVKEDPMLKQQYELKKTQANMI